MSMENLVSAARAAGFAMAFEDESSRGDSRDRGQQDLSGKAPAGTSEPMAERWQGSTQPAGANRSGSVLDWLPGFSWKP
jgi:hypothetical protein